MRKLILSVLLLAPFLTMAQTYTLNYDSVRYGKTAGVPKHAFYGRVFLKGFTQGNLRIGVNGELLKNDTSYIKNIANVLTPQTANTVITGGYWVSDGNGSVRSTIPSFLIARATDPSQATAEHGFADNTNINKIINNTAYASYDANVRIDGTADYNHNAGFESRLVYNSSGTNSNAYDYFSNPSFTKGITSSRYGLWIGAGGTSGGATIGKNVGIFINNLTTGTENYSIWTGSAPSRFQGDVNLVNIAATVGSGATLRYQSGNGYTNEALIQSDLQSSSWANLHFKVRTTSSAGDAGLNEVFGLYGSSSNYALFSSGVRFPTSGIVVSNGTGADATYISANGFVFNQTLQQVSSNFNIDGTGNAAKLGIGATSFTSVLLKISGGIIGNGATSGYGIRTDSPIQSDVTGNAFYNYAQIGTAAAAFTTTNAIGFSANQTTLGAGSAITNAIGFDAANTLSGGTATYGYRSSLAVGTGRWNLYMQGLAPNYIAGNTGFGTTAPSSLVTITGARTAGAWGTLLGQYFAIAPNLLTDNITADGVTVPIANINFITGAQINAANSSTGITYTEANTLAIGGAPNVSGTNAVITKAYALNVKAGAVRIGDLTASLFVKSGTDKSLVSFDLFGSNNTWTGSNVFTQPLGVKQGSFTSFFNATLLGASQNLYLPNASGIVAITDNYPTVTSGNLTLTGTGAGSGWYVFTGTTATWTLPQISLSIATTYYIKNRGSGILTINSFAGGNDIYTTTAVPTFTLTAGQSCILNSDGTYFNYQ